MYRFNALASVSSSSADSLVYTAHNFLGTRRGAGHECSGGGGGSSPVEWREQWKAQLSPLSGIAIDSLNCRHNVSYALCLLVFPCLPLSSLVFPCLPCLSCLPCLPCLPCSPCPPCYYPAALIMHDYNHIILVFTYAHSFPQTIHTHTHEPTALAKLDYLGTVECSENREGKQASRGRKRGLATPQAQAKMIHAQRMQLAQLFNYYATLT